MVSFATPETTPSCTPLRLHAAYMHTSAGSLGTEPSGNARQLFYGLPKATCQVTSGVTSDILVGCTPPVPTTLVGRNRWCRMLPRKPPRLHAAAAACCLHAHLSRKPWDGAAGTQIAGALGVSLWQCQALGVSLWQCQATVLWAPEGDVPGEPQAMPGNWEPLAHRLPEPWE